MKTGAAHSVQRTAACRYFAALLMGFSVHAEAQPRETFAERPGKRAERVVELRQQFNRDKSEVRNWARRRGVATRYDDGRRVVEAMALHNGRPVFYTTFNDSAAVSTAAHEVRDFPPFQAAGDGLTVGIWDGGRVMTNHQEFGGRVTAVDDAFVNYHATHVAGTIGASGIVLRARGMAPAVSIDSYDWDSDIAEMAAAAASYPGEDNTLYLSNHSYGILAGWFYAFWTNPWTRRSGYHWWGNIDQDTADEYFGQYGYGVSLWDQVVYEAPYYLPFKAAGNERNNGPTDGQTVYYTVDEGATWTNAVYDSSVHPLGDGVYKNGYDTIPYYGNAKNIMTVGAVTDAISDGMRNADAAVNTVFTSWGPSDDGRIKPDIVANGYELYSCNSANSSSYAVRSGTSMSSPNAAGSAALLVDCYGQLHPGQAMRASSLKGLIIHTADDLGPPGPDYQYGWGLMNTEAAAELIDEQAGSNALRLQEAMLSDSNTEDRYQTVAVAGEPIRVTLCWTDPPGTPQSGLDVRAPALVNDLDLKVIGPNGTHYPFRLDSLFPERMAVTDAENNVDNVEQVYISAPVSGTYTVVVDYDGSLADGRQWYSLLIDGLSPDQDDDGIPDSWQSDYFAGAEEARASADPDGDGYDNRAEYIAGSNPMDDADYFDFSAAYPLPDKDKPFVIEWESLPGRVYRVYRTYNLVYVPFEKISADIPYPIGSFTGTVEHAWQNSLYYKIDVRLTD